MSCPVDESSKQFMNNLLVALLRHVAIPTIMNKSWYWALENVESRKKIPKIVKTANTYLE